MSLKIIDVSRTGTRTYFRALGTGAPASKAEAMKEVSTLLNEGLYFGYSATVNEHSFEYPGHWEVHGQIYTD